MYLWNYCGEERLNSCSDFTSWCKSELWEISM